jgi:hypothetical protein
MLVVVMGRRLDQVLVGEANVLAGQQPARPLATHVRPLPLEGDRERFFSIAESYSVGLPTSKPCSHVYNKRDDGGGSRLAIT